MNEMNANIIAGTYFVHMYYKIQWFFHDFVDLTEYLFKLWPKTITGRADVIFSAIGLR